MLKFRPHIMFSSSGHIIPVWLTGAGIKFLYCIYMYITQPLSPFMIFSSPSVCGVPVVDGVSRFCDGAVARCSAAPCGARLAAARWPHCGRAAGWRGGVRRGRGPRLSPRPQHRHSRGLDRRSAAGTGIHRKQVSHRLY